MSKFGYGNYGGYRGTSFAEKVKVQEQISENRYFDLAWQLVDLIGQTAYETWVDETWGDEEMPWAQAVKLITEELESYECYCNPRNEPCQACQKLSAMRQKFEYDPASVPVITPDQDGDQTW